MITRCGGSGLQGDAGCVDGWRSRDGPSYNGGRQLMRPTWFEVPTKDIEVSKTFYKKALGWQYEEQGGMTMFKDDSGAFGHFWPLKGKLPKTAQVGLYLSVKSIATVLGKVQKAGGTVVQEKTTLPSGMGSVAMFADPLGVVWGLHSQK